MMHAARAGALMLICLAALLAAGCTTTGRESASGPAPGGRPDQAALEQALVDYASPGPPHARLASRAGTWDLDITYWERPDAEPLRTKGTSQVTAIWGGRYLVEHLKTEFDGEPFSGLGITGYDNFKNKFVSVWIDCLSTGIMRATGEGEGATIVYDSESVDFVNRSYKMCRSSERTIDADTRRIFLYDTDLDGNEFMSFEIVYRRKK
jgi:hypothetical protein